MNREHVDYAINFFRDQPPGTTLRAMTFKRILAGRGCKVPDKVISHLKYRGLIKEVKGELSWDDEGIRNGEARIHA